MDANVFYAQLQSRLMVNMAGSVMENAGLCLDRFGFPYIPGSAVKGCARRMAIQELFDLCQTEDQIPNSQNPPIEEALEKLIAIARVFGWRKQEWDSSKDSEGRFKSDFAWACDKHWPEIRSKALKVLNMDVDNGNSGVKDFAGMVSFLPGYPADLEKTGEIPGLTIELPDPGKLELDVVTVHHRNYYAEPDKENKRNEWDTWSNEWGPAPDTEEPVPNFFPTAAAGHVFVFALVPLRHQKLGMCPNLQVSSCSTGPESEKLPDRSIPEIGNSLSDYSEFRPVSSAREWLISGLSIFGIGAKTRAGYGWFADATEAIQKAEESKRKEEADKIRRVKEDEKRKAKRASLEPDLEFLKKLGNMKEPELRGQINPFATEPKFWTQKDETIQLTLLHFFLVTSPEVFAADRANPKSKLAKAISNLSTKFPTAVK